MRAIILCLAAALAATTSVHAQSYGTGQSGPRTLLQRSAEIALARSAAPPALADSATVYVLSGTGYEVAVRGTNGAVCYVSRDWLHSIEPHCFDAEGAASVFPMAMRRVELLHQGRTREEADREIADGLLAGRFRLPGRPVVSYMLSAAQKLVADDGRDVGAWKPHIMIYYPYWTGAGAAGPDVMLVDAGRPTASLIVVVPTFVQPGAGVVDAVMRLGDERAFAALYARHTPALYGLALRLAGGADADAHDVVHDAWVRAVERFAEFQWRSALATWLSGFVVHRWRELVRQRRREESLPLDDDAVGFDDEALAGTFDRLRLERAVASLAPGYRAVLVLHDVHGYTHDEIGTLLGIQDGTSKSQLARARRALRSALGTAEGA